MASRRSTPDIMGDLMGGISIKDENHKNIKPQSNKTVIAKTSSFSEPIHHSRTVKENTSQNPTEDLVEIDGAKEKITMMLPTHLLSELEDKWIELRKLIGSKQVSKSLIIQKSLELALIEFEKTKENSVIFFMISESIPLKQ